MILKLLFMLDILLLVKIYEVFRVIKDVTNNDMWVQSRGEGPAIDSGWAKLVNGNNLGTAATGNGCWYICWEVWKLAQGGLLTGGITKLG